MGQTTRFEIDVQKLKAELGKTGKTYAEHAREMGWGSGYFSNVFDRGVINGVVKKYLESIGIPYERIAKVEEKPKSIEINVPLNPDLQTRELLEVLKDINGSIHIIGNLLAQINEKIMK